MQKIKLILASGSPRRRELLQKAGVSFTVMASDAEERYHASCPSGIVRELSEIKARAVLSKLPEDSGLPVIVIGADTVVSVDGKILGKPADEEEALGMIQSIAGRSHEVYTGVTLIEAGASMKPDGIRTISFSECTRVHVVPMTEEEIRAYVACGESLDKAGAYAIQGAFGKYIDRFEGDYENVIGLPVARLLEELGKISGEDPAVFRAAE